jgi:hypothetical protein
MPTQRCRILSSATGTVIQFFQAADHDENNQVADAVAHGDGGSTEPVARLGQAHAERLLRQPFRDTIRQLHVSATAAAAQVLLRGLPQLEVARMEIEGTRGTLGSFPPGLLELRLTVTGPANAFCIDVAGLPACSRLRRLGLDSPSAPDGRWIHSISSLGACTSLEVLHLGCFGSCSAQQRQEVAATLGSLKRLHSLGLQGSQSASLASIMASLARLPALQQLQLGTVSLQGQAGSKDAPLHLPSSSSVTALRAIMDLAADLQPGALAAVFPGLRRLTASRGRGSHFSSTARALHGHSHLQHLELVSDGDRPMSSAFWPGQHLQSLKSLQSLVLVSQQARGQAGRSVCHE